MVFKVVTRPVNAVCRSQTPPSPMASAAPGGRPRAPQKRKQRKSPQGPKQRIGTTAGTTGTLQKSGRRTAKTAGTTAAPWRPGYGPGNTADTMVGSGASSYIWDNWPVNLDDDAACLGRFSLEAPRLGPPESRHENARIALFLPGKDGAYAKFCDVVDRAPAWSGSALNLTEIGRAHDLDALNTLSRCQPNGDDGFCSAALDKFLNTAIVLPYTSRTSVPPLWGFGVASHSTPQAISLCYKRAGAMAFEVHGEVLNPHRSYCENMRYYKTDDSRFVISAWRDPFIFFENYRYHMFFSARYTRAFYDEMPRKIQQLHAAGHRCSRDPRGYSDDINAAIGYATSTDLMTWDLQKPLLLPGNGAQFELPTCTRVGDSHVLTTAVCDGCVTSQNTDLAESMFGPRRQYLAAFRTDAALANINRPDAWTALNDHINGDTHPLRKTYGLTFRGVGNKVFATAFDDRAYTFTSVVEMSRDAFPYNIPSEHDQRWGLTSRDHDAS